MKQLPPPRHACVDSQQAWSLIYDAIMKSVSFALADITGALHCRKHCGWRGLLDAGCARSACPKERPVQTLYQVNLLKRFHTQ